MLEAELAWTRPEEEGGRGLEDVMECVESCIMRIAADLAAHRKQELQDVFPKGWQVVESLLSAPSSGASAPSHRWKRIVYKDAIRELRDVYAHDREVFQHAPDYEEGLRSEHERWLADKYGPTFVTDYPASQKPFYMRVNGDAHSAGAAKTVACFDLLVPRIGELAGGSLREERLDVLEQAMRDKGMSLEEYSWYLDLRRYGSVGHGGFGLGWERLISWLTGLENVRECIAFPRGSEGSRF
jgi:asparaginyl-tRNA synthetase